MIIIMKTVRITLLFVLFVLPMLAPWASHDILQAMHSYHESHHKVEVHTHHDDGHQTKVVLKNTSHPLHFDIVTYFRDYLHVDLPNPQQDIFQVAKKQVQTGDLETNNFVYNIPSPRLASLKEEAPPDNYFLLSLFSNEGLYLSTQRLRI